ncbi:pre-rRNA-processing protein pno1 [Mycoblastus sanguinarius]|nr:pre-rRNA-processing protein pno1 [Mycoblastus sanguinarius]
MNVRARAVELKTSKHSTDPSCLQKGEDFVKAFSLGFEVEDAIALLRLDDLYIETFEIKDVKTLNGEHMGRAIGRIGKVPLSLTSDPEKMEKPNLPSKTPVKLESFWLIQRFIYWVVSEIYISLERYYFNIPRNHEIKTDTPLKEYLFPNYGKPTGKA